MTKTDVFLSFVTSLLASVVAITIVLILERQRRPRPSLVIGDTAEIPPGDSLGRPQTKWLHVDVLNEPIGKWIGWAYDRLPAPQCRAWVTFHHLDGHRVFPREMHARWAETTEPKVEIITTSQGQVRMLQGEQHVVDIPPGGRSAVDIIARQATDDICYGWCNESYLHGWRHPDWSLPKGRYMARVRVRTSGREFTGAFLLANDVAYDSVRLEPIAPEHLKALEAVVAIEGSGGSGECGRPTRQ